MPDDVATWVLEAARAMADDPDRPPKGPFASRHHLVSAGQMYYPEPDVEAAIAEYLGDGTFLGWHGLIAPADPDRLRAVIEYERTNDNVRYLLIGKCNRYLAGDIERYTGAYGGGKA